MTDLDLGVPLSRRRALALGGVVAGGLLSTDIARARGGRASARAAASAHSAHLHKLPATKMQDILEAEGTVSSGVLQVSIDRDDIQDVTLRGTPIRPAFEISGDLTFQPLAHGKAFFNGDLALKPDEVNPVIDAILANGLVFQAEHQHFYDFDPPVWFIHFRGHGSPLTLAKAVHGVLKATSTPLPQKQPSDPKTPLDKARLQKILHGDSAEVGNDGVVTVSVPRKNRIHVAGIRVAPEANISTNIGFQPLDATAGSAAAAPDFGMEAHEINHVVRTMRAQGWDIGCLYNQESDEHPQLYFSHQFKTGDPYALAREIRRGLDRMNTK